MDRTPMLKTLTAYVAERSSEHSLAERCRDALVTSGNALVTFVASCYDKFQSFLFHLAWL